MIILTNSMSRKRFAIRLEDIIGVYEHTEPCSERGQEAHKHTNASIKYLHQRIDRDYQSGELNVVNNTSISIEQTMDRVLELMEKEMK